MENLIAKNKLILEKEAQETREQILSLSRNSQIGSNPEDESTESEIDSNTDPVEADLKTRLNLLKQALRRIADNTYGICLYCQKKISAERLRVFKSA